MVTNPAQMPMPGLFDRLVAGLAGGLAGGVVFGVLMQLTGTIPLVAKLVGHESMVVGWTVHMSIAIFVSTTYVLIFGAFSVVLSLSTVLGLFYGLVWWVLGGLTLMPLRLGMGLFVFDSAAWQSLAGHAAYGLALGVTYALVAQVLAGADANPAEATPEDAERADPAGSEDAGRPALPPPSSQPAGFLAAGGPGRQPPRPPRAGVVPLSPSARALRQRRS